MRRIREFLCENTTYLCFVFLGSTTALQFGLWMKSLNAGFFLWGIFCMMFCTGWLIDVRLGEYELNQLRRNFHLIRGGR